jgi:protein-S-isoprenylcysteine O-methyltransferase Ste14
VDWSAKLITAAPFVIVAAFVVAYGERPWSVTRAAGIGLLVVGLCFLTVARVYFEASFPTLHSPRLVTQGIYKRIRHPIYTFSLITFAGLLLYLDEPWALSLMIPILVVQIWRARREERVMEAYFGEEYRRYKQQTWF